MLAEKHDIFPINPSKYMIIIDKWKLFRTLDDNTTVDLQSYSQNYLVWLRQELSQNK